MINEHLEQLRSENVLDRTHAMAALTQHPLQARPALVQMVRSTEEPTLARLFAIYALSQMGDDDKQDVVMALLAIVGDPAPEIRAGALRALGQLEAAEAVEVIASHLTDDEEIPGAWFDDDCQPLHAARDALERIGTPKALAALTRPKGAR